MPRRSASGSGAMRVRIYRPGYQKRARTLLAIALLLPPSGVIGAAGLNPISVTFLAICVAGAGFILGNTFRPVVTALRHGILIAGSAAVPEAAVAWVEITAVEVQDGVVSLTAGDTMYQLQVDSRSAAFLGRMAERHVFAPRDL